MKYDHGYIYVLKNHSMPGLLKVGYTKRNVQERARELSSATGVPTPFEIAYSQESFYVRADEINIHKKLSEYRHGEGEFFKIEYDDAINYIKEIVAPSKEVADKISGTRKKASLEQIRLLRIKSSESDLKDGRYNKERELKSTIDSLNHSKRMLDVSSEKVQKGIRPMKVIGQAIYFAACYGFLGIVALDYFEFIKFSDIDFLGTFALFFFIALIISYIVEEYNINEAKKSIPIYERNIISLRKEVQLLKDYLSTEFKPSIFKITCPRCSASLLAKHGQSNVQCDKCIHIFETEHNA